MFENDYQQQLMDRIIQVLEEEHWVYTQLANTVDFSLSVPGLLRNFYITIEVFDDSALVKVSLPLGAYPDDPELMDRCMELCVRMNMNVIQGAFYIDMDTGAFRFGLEIDARRHLPDPSVILNAILVPLSTAQDFACDLAAVLFNGANPAELFTTEEEDSAAVLLN